MGTLWLAFRSERGTMSPEIIVDKPEDLPETFARRVEDPRRRGLSAPRPVLRGPAGGLRGHDLLPATWPGAGRLVPRRLLLGRRAGRAPRAPRLELRPRLVALARARRAFRQRTSTAWRPTRPTSTAAARGYEADLVRAAGSPPAPRRGPARRRSRTATSARSSRATRCCRSESALRGSGPATRPSRRRAGSP